jgi:hypothetical protein
MEMTVPRRFPEIGPEAALVGAALLSVAIFGLAPAAAAGKSSDACFLRQDVDGFSAPDDHTVYLRVGSNRIYRLDLMTRCLDLTFRQRIGLEHQPASPWVCSPLEATVVYNATGIQQRCPVKAIHKLTPEEVAALPKKDRP